MSARSMQAARTALFQQLSAAVRHGLPLAEVAQALVADDQWTRSARAALQRMAKALEGGVPLSTAMAAEPALFAGETAVLVQAAETLAPAAYADVLAALAADARREAAAARAIAITMTWPLTLGLVLLVVLSVCAFYVRPAIRDLFDSVRAAPPLPFMAASFIDSAWAWLPLVYLALLLWYLGWLPRPLLAVLGQLVDDIGFVRRWRSAVQAGRLLAWLPLCDAQPALRDAVVQHLAATTRPGPTRTALRGLHAALQRGTPLVAALASERALPARMALLARLGERSSSLPAVLHELRSDAVDDEALAFARFERSCVVLSNGLIGFFVAMLLACIYLPIFKLGTVI